MTWRRQTDDSNNPHTVVFDIDGVLADNSRRNERLDPRNPDWTEFHSDQHLDPPIEANVTLLRILARGGYHIVLMTNRFEAYRAPTMAWLAKHEIPYRRLIMRQRGTPYTGAKGKAVQELIDEGYLVKLVVDDDPDHCQDITEVTDVPCLYVHSGYKDYFTRHWPADKIPDDPIGALPK